VYIDKREERRKSWGLLRFSRCETVDGVSDDFDKGL